MTQWDRSCRGSLTLLLLVSACGGQRVGNEDYFAGAPLPPPEPDRPKAAAASASASVQPSSATAPAKPTCHDSPAQGFPRCDPDQRNAPCVYGAIGGCLIKCEGAEPPVPAPCPPPAPNGPMPQP